MTYLELAERRAKIGAARLRKSRREAKGRLLWRKERARSGSTRAALETALDREFSQIVRRRAEKRFGGCPFHMMRTRPITSCFHFVTRAKDALRWDFRNAAGSCDYCNVRFEADTAFVETVKAWYADTFGGLAWQELERDGNKLALFSVDELEGKLAELRKINQEER